MIDIINALKDIFCDVGSPDKLISDNATYFKSKEFQDFIMDWSIQHITSSLRYPLGNSMAEKAVGIVKELYAICDNVKLGLLLMKTTPVTGERHQFQAPANVFFGHTLKANLPIYWSSSTCTLDTENGADSKNCQLDPPSKFGELEKVWVKLDNNTKWIEGQITQVLPNQSYMAKLLDGHIFHQNEHHLTRRLSCLKPRATSEASETFHSYNLWPRKAVKHVQWPDIPAEARQGTDFKLPDEF